MKWIEFTEEKPPESDVYYIKGRKDYKAVAYYYADKETWELGDLAYNYFTNDYIYWLKEL
jgi:hypothetical protein